MDIKTTYKLKIAGREGTCSFKELVAAPIKIKGFEFMDLYCYCHPGTFNLVGCDLSLDEQKGKYVISENQTGYYCGKPFDSPEQCYFEFTKHLNDLGVEKVREIMQEVLNNGH
jgi:hypothetical protein